MLNTHYTRGPGGLAPIQTHVRSSRGEEGGEGEEEGGEGEEEEGEGGEEEGEEAAEEAEEGEGAGG